MVVILGITDKAGEWTVRNATAAAVAFFACQKQQCRALYKVIVWCVCSRVCVVVRVCTGMIFGVSHDHCRLLAEAALRLKE